MTRRTALGIALLCALSACGDGEGGVDPGPAPALQFGLVASGLENPVFLTVAPGDSTRLFVLEQEGRIRVIRNDSLLPTPFLDIEDSVSHGNEQGLLGLAFAPDYPTSGAFYVFTTDPAGVVLDAWSTRLNPEGPVGATHIHGITDRDVANAPLFRDVIPHLNNRLAGSALCAHNARFDLAFLRAEYARAG